MTTTDLSALIRKAAKAALDAQAEAAQKASRALAPKDTGGLAESILVSKSTQRGLVSQVYSDADYAVYQHEALDLHHSSGQAKFMENAVTAERARIVDAGSDAARAVFTKGA